MWYYFFLRTTNFLFYIYKLEWVGQQFVFFLCLWWFETNVKSVSDSVKVDRRQSSNLWMKLLPSSIDVYIYIYMLIVFIDGLFWRASAGAVEPSPPLRCFGGLVFFIYVCDALKSLRAKTTREKTQSVLNRKKNNGVSHMNRGHKIKRWKKTVYIEMISCVE